MRRINGRGYKAYKDLQKQEFSFPGLTLHVDHVH
ncbi:MAG: ABC-ATPase domain-containing protein [Dehalococcoidia bacterium]